MADSKLTALTEVSVPDLDDLNYLVDVSDTTDDAAGSSRKVTLRRQLALCGITPGGRITLESGVPVSTSSQTSKSTIYYTPYTHDWVRLYDGTRPKLYQFTERSLALSGLTSGKNYDVFLYDNAGTLTLELSAAWTNDTTRADALAWQAGVGYVKSGTATRLWLGTIRTTGTTTTGLEFGSVDTKPYCFLKNTYNRVRAAFRWSDSTNSWSYSSTTLRAMNNSENARFEFVEVEPGVVDAAVHIHIGGSGNGQIAVGYDTTTAVYTAIAQYNAVGQTGVMSESVRTAAGYHYIAPLEGCGSGTATFYGDAGVSTPYSLFRAIYEY